MGAQRIPHVGTLEGDEPRSVGQVCRATGGHTGG